MSRSIKGVTNSGTWRFLGRGVGDLERRMSGVAESADSVDATVVRVLAGSTGVRMVVRIVTAVAAAGRTSTVMRAWRALLGPWRDLAMPARRRLLGTGLLCAVASHVLLSLLGDPPAGWYWLIMPSIAAAVGLVLAAVSPAVIAEDR